MSKLVIGLDFGSDSARAVLADASDGHVISTASMAYPLWSEGRFCDPSASMYRQSPSDYRAVLERILPEVLASKPARSRLVAIGVDTTASTPCLLDAALQPLSEEDPDAMFVLWKDHTAEREAAEITSVAGEFLSGCGGVYSAENFWSKVLHIVRTNPDLASRAVQAVEQCDYVAWLLSGTLRRSRCAAACKQLWNGSLGGNPPESFFKLFGRDFARIASASLPDTSLPSEVCGTLSQEWCERLGVDDVIVSVGNVDAHSGAVGAGCSADTMVLNLGTSACIMAVSEAGGAPVPGVFAQAPDIIIPGLVGYEMGLSSFGDNFAWVSRLTGRSISELSELAASIKPSPRLPLCTDWFNGRRSPLPDSCMRASICGLGLSTAPEDLFWGVVEASCFGIRAIVDHLESYSVSPRRIVAAGGVAQKSGFVVGMLSDVLGRDVAVSPVKEACALGAAMNASVAAGLYPDLQSAQSAMGHEPIIIHHPANPSSHDERYAGYKRMM